MTEPRGFTKHYPTATARATALANYRWLREHAGPLRVPALLAIDDQALTFAHVAGRHARPADLRHLASQLGDAHGAAWFSTLHGARLDRPHASDDRHTLRDFASPRLAALRRLGIVEHDARRLVHNLAQRGAPAAFYKDANPRNWLIAGDRPPMAVDVDDLTLAPFGYDLAKLVVGLAMTHGPLPSPLIHDALSAYNTATVGYHTSLSAVTIEQLHAYADIHDLLTAPYLGRGGYRHRWRDLQPASRRSP